MRKCLLHIGSHKTGTSAIQKALANSDSDLKKSGFFYSKSCKHTCDYSSNSLSLSLINNQESLFFENLKKLEQETQENNDLNMLFSSEILERCPPSSSLFDYFVRFLNQNFDLIDVVFCLRDHYSMCNSVFKQFVSNPQSPYCGSIDQFLNYFIKSNSSIPENICAWSKIPKFNNFYLFWYSPDFYDNFKNISQAAELDFIPSDPGIVNRSLDGIFLSLNYYYNLNCKKHDPEFIRKIKQLAISCKDANLYYKSSIVFNEKVNLLDNNLSNLQFPSNVIYLNQKITEDRSKYKDFLYLNNKDDFLSRIKLINLACNSNIDMSIL